MPRTTGSSPTRSPLIWTPCPKQLARSSVRCSWAASPGCAPDPRRLCCCRAKGTLIRPVRTYVPFAPDAPPEAKVRTRLLSRRELTQGCLDRLGDRGVLGLDPRAEPAEHLAVARHEELLEVPLHVARGPVGVGVPRQLLVERMRSGPVHLDLLVQGERHPVRRRAERGDLL